MRAIRRDHPQPFDLPARDPIHDLIVRERVSLRDARRVDAENAGDFFAMLRVEKIVTAEQIRRVGKKPRAHRVALSGDRVRAGPGASDVPRHQREIDDRLRRARGLVALIHAHRPPKRHALPAID